MECPSERSQYGVYRLPERRIRARPDHYWEVGIRLGSLTLGSIRRKCPAGYAADPHSGIDGSSASLRQFGYPPTMRTDARLGYPCTGYHFVKRHAMRANPFWCASRALHPRATTPQKRNYLIELKWAIVQAARAVPARCKIG